MFQKPLQVLEPLQSLHEFLEVLQTPRRLWRFVVLPVGGVAAFVQHLRGQFDSFMQDWRNAKEALHGCDIYSGCCTLKIEYAKPTKLNVYKNDADSWDYTNPNLGSGKGRDRAGTGDSTEAAAVSQGCNSIDIIFSTRNMSQVMFGVTKHV